MSSRFCFKAAVPDKPFSSGNEDSSYTLGSSTNYNEIYRLRKQVLDKFPEAFIIAFRNGQRMDVQEAVGEFRRLRIKG